MGEVCMQNGPAVINPIHLVSDTSYLHGNRDSVDGGY